MRSRREQLQAHRFVTRRIVSAVLAGEPESPEQPMRRFGLAAFASVMVAAIVVAGFAVFGLLRPSASSAWRTENALVIEKETGARFIYRGGRLHPVVNFASARLIAGGGASPVTVARASLDGLPRDVPYGIAGAPDGIPAPDALVGLPWRVCSYLAAKGVPGAASAALVLGPQLAGGAEVGARALLVKGPQGQKYLLWSGRRLRLPSGTSEAALGYTGTEAIEVAPALLNAIPAGHDLAVTIRDVGAASPRNKARRVGQLFRVERAGGGTDYYVMLAGGLSRLTDVGYSLVRAAPEVTRVFGSQPPVTAISPGDVGVTVPSELAGLPATPPELAELTGDDPAVCAERGADAGANPSAVIRLFGAAPALLDGARPAPEKVLVPGGRGALVRTPGKALFLVTDDGRRFGLPSAEATSALGYADVTPLDVPAELIALIPQGPALDPAAARLPVAR